MIHGLDTGFLVAAEVTEHAEHAEARATLTRLLGAGDRKRLLDTLLAATYRQVGIHSLLTTNPADFGVFGVFTCITPKTAAPAP
jgi:predicted nucleic acid-binding protein